MSHIYISDLKEGVFFAEIHLSNGIKELQIDARPSDAIAIALRFDVPIFTNEKLLEEAGIIVSDEELAEENELEGEELVTKATEIINDEPTENTATIEELNKKLKEALAKEDYETAVKIRDEIQRKEG